MSRRWLLSPISLSWTARTFCLSDALMICKRGDAQGKVTIGTRSSSLEDIFTPRPIQYSPETSLRQPELTTVKQGRTNLKLADYITTWKMSVIDSNETAETDVRAFQPFFAELDPPRVLTEGDRISLPVVLRNYLDHKPVVAMQTKSASSTVCDYCNPEAKAVVAQSMLS